MMFRSFAEAFGGTPVPDSPRRLVKNEGKIGKREQPCGKKTRHLSQDAAAAVVKKYPGMRCYHCGHCGYWHVGGKEYMTQARRGM